ncbi:hypothetical protein BS78_05G277600 [Paspalum vaginatum]|nr:hypothetical protein BS78_05G277600 [Paspalum vaginatum]
MQTILWHYCCSICRLFIFFFRLLAINRMFSHFESFACPCVWKSSIMEFMIRQTCIHQLELLSHSQMLDYKKQAGSSYMLEKVNRCKAVTRTVKNSGTVPPYLSEV